MGLVPIVGLFGSPSKQIYLPGNSGRWSRAPRSQNVLMAVSYTRNRIKVQTTISRDLGLNPPETECSRKRRIPALSGVQTIVVRNAVLTERGMSDSAS